MARKFGRNRRFVPSTERALFKHDHLTGRHIDRTDLIDAIRGGEDSYLEFKVRFSNPDKIAAGICALANSGGGTIVFGVTDQLRLEGVTNPETLEQDLLTICREQLVPSVWPRIDKVAFDSGLRLVVVEVDVRRAPHRTIDGRFFVRVGSAKREATAEEIAELFRGRTGARGFEDTPLATSDAGDDIDEGSVWGYVRELGVDPGIREGYKTDALLRDMRLAVSYGDDLVPTVAGVLLFGISDSVTALVPSSPVIVERRAGPRDSSEVVEEIELRGNLASLHDRALGFVERYGDLWDHRPKRREASPIAARPFLPRAAVVEALSNALVHRDLSQQLPTRVVLYDDRLVVTNPAPPSGLTRRSLRLGVKEATNPRIKGLFESPAYGIRRFHGGIPMMTKVVHEFTHREALRLVMSSEGFRVEVPAV